MRDLDKRNKGSNLYFEQANIYIHPDKLYSGERVIYHTKLHWIHLARPAMLVVVGLFCTLALNQFREMI